MHFFNSINDNNQNSKLRTYTLVKNTYGIEPYILAVNNKKNINTPFSDSEPAPIDSPLKPVDIQFRLHLLYLEYASTVNQICVIL